MTAAFGVQMQPRLAGGERQNLKFTPEKGGEEDATGEKISVEHMRSECWEARQQTSHPASKKGKGAFPTVSEVRRQQEVGRSTELPALTAQRCGAVRPCVPS